MTPDCSECFHYGKSPKTGEVQCVIRCQCDVYPGDCRYFVRWEGR